MKYHTQATSDTTDVAAQRKVDPCYPYTESTIGNVALKGWAVETYVGDVKRRHVLVDTFDEATKIATEALDLASTVSRFPLVDYFDFARAYTAAVTKERLLQRASDTLSVFALESNTMSPELRTSIVRLLTDIKASKSNPETTTPK